jgi:hypothetical protein
MYSWFAVVVLGFVTLASTTGCASILGRKLHGVVVESEPPGADVYVNGMRMGRTPMTLELKADKAYNIEFRKSGYEPVTRFVNTRIVGGWIMLDVATGVLPLVFDAATGAWNQLDQKHINVVLDKTE